MTEQTKTPEVHEYVTLDGKEPEQAQPGFLGSKGFIILAILGTALIGVVIYAMLL